MKNLQKNHYLILGGWFIINLLQAVFTGLHSDESYYWLYSQNMAWGYFDHPPMIALLIHIGHLLLPGEAGIRLILVILSTITLAVILNELNEQKDLLFLSVFVFSFPLIHTHIAGFIALPDIPLLFFTLIFLILYRKFLNKPTIRLSVLLAIVVAAMIYSKYHAFLIIGFTVLSNLKLLRQKYFWIVVVLAIILLIPHILWQAENEFPTFKYHLIERTKPFRLKYVLPYLLDQLIMAGPLTGVLVFWKLAGFKIKNKFDRALIFNIAGFYILFFLMSFKNRIEAHWTAAITPMMMLIVYPLISSDPKIKIWFKRLAIPVIILMFLARIYFALDIIPNVGHIKITFYNKKEHAREIKNMAGDKTVGFFNNYAAISNYIFYTGDSAAYLATPYYRYSQYDLWDYEKCAEGKEVFAIQSKDLDPPNLQRMVTGKMKGYIIIEEFQSLEGLKINLAKTGKNKSAIKLNFVLTNTNNHPIYTDHVSEPSLGIQQDKREISSVPLTSGSEKIRIEPGEKATIEITVPEYKLDKKIPIIFYTRSKDMVRGELISFKYDQL